MSFAELFCFPIIHRQEMQFLLPTFNIKDKETRSVTQTGLNMQDFNTPCVIIRRPHTRPRLPTQQHTSLDTCFSGSFSSARNLHLKWGKFPQHRPKRSNQPFAFGLWMKSSPHIQAAFFVFPDKVQLQCTDLTANNTLLCSLIYPKPQQCFDLLSTRQNPLNKIASLFSVEPLMVLLPLI